MTKKKTAKERRAKLPPVGLEILAAPPLPTLNQFIRLLRIHAQNLPDQPLAIGELANVIGCALGNNVPDKTSLVREFEAGFRHGVQSTRTEKPDWDSFFQSARQWDEPK